MTQETDVNYEISLGGHEEDSSTTGPFLIDSIEKPILWFIIVFLMGFIAIRLVSSTWTTAGKQRKSEIVEIKKPLSDSTFNVDLDLTSLSEFHKKIALKCSLILDSREANVKEIDYSFIAHYLRNKSIVDSKTLKDEKAEVSFLLGSKESNEIEIFVFNEKVNFDEIDLQLAITANYNNVVSVRFIWELESNNSDKFFVLSRLILTGMILYMLTIFLLHATFKNNAQVQSLGSILGVFGVISGIPLKTFITPENYPMINCILSSILIYTYRLFCILAIRGTENRTGGFSYIIFTLYGLLYVALTVIFVLTLTGVNTQFSDGSILLFMSILEIIAIGYELFSKFVFNSIVSMKRYIYFCAMSFANILFDLTIQNKFAFPISSLRQSVSNGLWPSLHVVLCVFLLFLMQNNFEEGYNQIDNVETHVPEFIDIEGVIGVDVHSEPSEKE